MVQLKLLLLFSLAAAVGTAESNTLAAPSQCEATYEVLSRREARRGISFRSRAIESQLPLGPSIPLNMEYVPYQGNVENVMLSVNKYHIANSTLEMCGKMAAMNGAHFWTYSCGKCYMARLLAPICRSRVTNETKIFILEPFLTDGTPDDDPFPNPERTKELMHGEPHVAFRVMPPTAIAQFPEFMTQMGHSWEKSTQAGKVFKLSKLGGFVAFDASLPIDPSCHTNSSCGVPFLTTSVAAVTSRHVALDQACGRVIKLNDAAAINVFSHEGIGCKLFPCVYPSPNCELTVTSCHPISVSASLVNFRKKTCGGYELRVFAVGGGRVLKEVDMCEENFPTEFSALSGKVKIILTGSPEENWDRYGFNIRLESNPNADGSSVCPN